MATLINAINCNHQLLGTGIVPCTVKLGRIKSVLRVDPSWTFDPATETFDLDYVISKVQDGTFAPFLNTLAFANNTPETTTKEFEDGAIYAIRDGKPQFSMEYDNGIMWHQAAYSYNGNRTSSVILIDASGNVGLYRNVAGTQLTAMLTNMFSVPTWMPQVGDENAKTFINFQIESETAWNERLTVISVQQIGADLNDELKGFLNVTITGTASVANGISVTINAVANTSFGITGLTAPNFRVRDTTDNTVETIDTVTAGATHGTYTIVLDPALTVAHKVVVEMYDTTAGVDTALVGTNLLYKGASAEMTVGA